jgi:hypothetical protein
MLPGPTLRHHRSPRAPRRRPNCANVGPSTHGYPPRRPRHRHRRFWTSRRRGARASRYARSSWPISPRRGVGVDHCRCRGSSIGVDLVLAVHISRPRSAETVPSIVSKARDCCGCPEPPWLPWLPRALARAPCPCPWLPWLCAKRPLCAPLCPGCFAQGFAGDQEEVDRGLCAHP